uniref:Uncharacterized protein n=1 Tax=Arundo donax TaxID=35708 RepID=A0A0A8Z516_ARUDO
MSVQDSKYYSTIFSSLILTFRYP